MSENDYFATNRRHWDEVVPLHVASRFYDTEGFKKNPSSLTPVELSEVGEVAGRTLLHLQCHFGMDSISWARRGAMVTAVDFSEAAINRARELATATGTEVEFVVSNVYDAPAVVQRQFDIVFTSYGVLCWLPDIPRWANVVAGLVRPGGFFYIAEFHPFAAIFDDDPEELRVRYPYFPTGEPLVFDGVGTYTDRETRLVNDRTYEFPFTLSDVITSLVDAGLRIEFMHEFPFSVAQFLPFTREIRRHEVRLRRHDGSVPLMFSVRASKPA